MADAVIMFVVERLGNLLIQDAKLLSNVSSQVEEIQSELRRMKCFLKDAYARQGGDERVRNWIRDVRNLAEKTEDLLEIYAIKVSSGALTRFACIFSEGIALHKIGSEIVGVKSKISNLATSLQTYGIRSIDEGESSRANRDEERQRWQRMSYPHLIEDYFVGMEDDIEQLVSHLINHVDRRLRVVSIWGMGGLGKTTLAKKVYNHIIVRRIFEGFAWVCVTQQCQTRKALQDILKELVPRETREEIMNMGDHELVLRLHNVQQEKKCLIVLDDVWKIEDWEQLRPAFPIEKTSGGSKLFVTTRIKEVAKIGYVHELQYLSGEDGWELLRRKAFRERRDQDQDIEVSSEMEKLGREMVRQCGGLPLAIAVLGGTLKTKWTLEEWEMVNRDVASYLSRGEGIEDRHVTVREVLALGFNNLPGRLRPCFLYLGQFAEDDQISVGGLYLKWIAEGMISTEDQGKGETLMDVAERYLGELAERSMVQIELYDESTWKLNRRIKTCHLHDLMHDLCSSKRKEDEFYSVMTIKSHRNQHASSSTNVVGDGKARRLTIYFDHDQDDENVTLKPILGSIDCHIRSLLLRYNIHKQKHWTISSCTSRHIEYSSSLEKFTLLRVLELERINFPNGKLPRGVIKRLVHLRYLRLEFCNLKELSSSICDLRYLQILNLKRIYNSPVIIPHVLWKMEQLTHLLLPVHIRIKREKKLRLDGLRKLEILTSISTSVCNVKDVAKLSNLRHIELEINGSFEDVVWFENYLNMAITTSHHIRSVNLYCRNYDFHGEEGLSLLRLVFGCPIRLYWSLTKCKLPELSFDPQNCYLVNLTHIWISDSIFEGDLIKILKKLPNLQSLALCKIFLPKKQMECSAADFPQLKVLKLQGLSNLEVWRMDQGAMPNLSRLVIRACGMLRMLPDQLRYLTTLRSLCIQDMPEEFGARVRVVNGVEGADFDKVRHVLSVIIT